MIIAVDSSVLLDVLIDGAPHAHASYRALAEAVSCPVVWAEVSALLGDGAGMDALVEAGIEFDPFDRERVNWRVACGMVTASREAPGPVSSRTS